MRLVKKLFMANLFGSKKMVSITAYVMHLIRSEPFFASKLFVNFLGDQTNFYVIINLGVSIILEIVGLKVD